MGTFDAAARRIATDDRRADTELVRSIAAGLNYIAHWWPLDERLTRGAVADLARDATALLLAGGGSGADVVDACGRLPRLSGPTVGERGAERAGSADPAGAPDGRRWRPTPPPLAAYVHDAAPGAGGHDEHTDHGRNLAAARPADD